ncbi:hypothetical protein D3C86_1997910 [compost metagenome]
MLAYVVADPQVCLMRNEQIDVVGGVAVGLQSLLDHLAKPYDRMFENRIAIHIDVMPTAIDYLLAYRATFAAAPRIFHIEFFCKAAVGVEVCR